MEPEEQAEAAELERAAEWRDRMADSDPASAAAAARLRDLAADLRRLEGSAPLHEFRCLCNWLGESDAIQDLADLVRDYNKRIGTHEHPADGEAYLRALLALAHRAFGAP